MRIGFNHKGLEPVPKRFKGAYVTGQNFIKANCNRKIIGDHFFSNGMKAANGRLELANLHFFRSPHDADGHGTHTASTVVDMLVLYANMVCIAPGTSRGGAPSVRIAVYKACWFDNCHEPNIMSDFDEVITDGVDIISISIGFSSPKSFIQGTIVIGSSFHAFPKGILVSASTGNVGGQTTVANIALQMLTGTSMNREELKSKHGIIAGKAAAVHGVLAANARYVTEVP